MQKQKIDSRVRFKQKRSAPSNVLCGGCVCWQWSGFCKKINGVWICNECKEEE